MLIREKKRLYFSHTHTPARVLSATNINWFKKKREKIGVHARVFEVWTSWIHTHMFYFRINSDHESLFSGSQFFFQLKKTKQNKNRCIENEWNWWEFNKKLFVWLCMFPSENVWMYFFVEFFTISLEFRQRKRSIVYC